MIQKSTTADVPNIAAMLQRSFDDDPVVNWFIRQDARRAAAFDEFFTLALTRQTLPFGEAYHFDAYQGAALWVPPGRWRLGYFDQVCLAPSIFRISGLSILRRVLGGLSAMEANHPADPHMYLLFLAADPAHRGKGIGTTMLSAMTRSCDEARLPIYLENTKEVNEPFYRQHGFEVTGDIRLASDSPYYTSMWRRPQ